VIILSVGDPYTAQLNRFYTIEFFREAGRILADGGVLSFGLSSSESYMSREERDFLSSIYSTLASAFTNVLAIPGETVYFLASGGENLLTYDYNILMKRADERRLDLKYVREYYLASRLSDQKISFVKNSIALAGQVMINRDFRPISYYYDMVFWAARFKGSVFTAALKSMNAKLVFSFAGLSVFLILLSGLLGNARAGSLRRAAILAIAANGFSQITFQVVILIAFQIIYGYVFYKVGIIVTAFMAGIALGGLYGIRALPHMKDERRYMISVQAGLCLYPLGLLSVLWFFSAAASFSAEWIGSNIVFIVLPVISGFIGGALFPFANKAIAPGIDEVGHAGSLSYGVDLLGSCAGALVVGTVLVPILGIPATCFAVSCVNAAVLVVILTAQSSKGL
jgi:spermidine synthase